MSRKSLSLSGALALIAAIAAVPTIALAGSHSQTTPTAQAAATHTVSLSGFSFHPSSLTIKRGDSVRWSWNIPKSEHNVTFRSVHSHTGSSGSLTVKFPNAGTFSYVCTVHVSKGMKGKVVVR
ncbi:MAG TPA: plastocyanin/azurin family copper-binding protein [Solirubrobacteraceae bacterium]|jgi:plastocyanin|nr:plastocyanin/azurin family copper-binding protein [Solirubrobacteraceae bacterium]